MFRLVWLRDVDSSVSPHQPAPESSLSPWSCVFFLISCKVTTLWLRSSFQRSYLYTATQTQSCDECFIAFAFEFLHVSKLVQTYIVVILCQIACFTGVCDSRIRDV